MEHRTIEEYKEDVFDLLDDKTKLEWMYQMSEQLCNIAEYVKELYDDTDDMICYDIDKNRKKELLKMLGETNER